MSSTRPLQWIEQAEARQMMTDAMFRQAPAASRRKRAQNVHGWKPWSNAFSRHHAGTADAADCGPLGPTPDRAAKRIRARPSR